MIAQHIKAQWKVKELIQRFEVDIIFGRLPLPIKICRSSALNDLLHLGKDALSSIADHLSQKPPAEERGLLRAWLYLLDQLKCCFPNSTLLHDEGSIECWIIWARENAH